jgi:hypothetical protein
MDNQKMNIYTLIAYIIHSPFGDTMLLHDLWLDIEYNLMYATNVILVVKVSCNCFITTNWNHKLLLFFRMYKTLDICSKCGTY